MYANGSLNGLGETRGGRRDPPPPKMQMQRWDGLVETSQDRPTVSATGYAIKGGAPVPLRQVSRRTIKTSATSAPMMTTAVVPAPELPRPGRPPERTTAPVKAGLSLTTWAAIAGLGWYFLRGRKPRRR